MEKESVKNIIILKNLPSNLIDEAIIVVKDKKKIKNADFTNLIFDGKKPATTYKDNKIIQGYMKEEDIKKIENINKENRKYVIQEAEFVVTNYINKIEKKFSDTKNTKFEKKYKIMRILNFALGIAVFISIIISANV